MTLIMNTTMPTMPTDDRLHTAAGELLAKGGHRYTTARRRLVGALQKASAPATIPQLLAMDAELVQSSAYRNLAILVDAGVVTRIVTVGDHAAFELDERLTDRHHHHIVCVDCGDVRDFELSDGLEQILEKELGRTAEANGFTIDCHRLDLLGTCNRCS